MNTILDSLKADLLIEHLNKALETNNYPYQIKNKSYNLSDRKELVQV